jgi:hypothetical protein
MTKDQGLRVRVDVETLQDAGADGLRALAACLDGSPSGSSWQEVVRLLWRPELAGAEQPIVDFLVADRGDSALRSYALASLGTFDTPAARAYVLARAVRETEEEGYRLLSIAVGPMKPVPGLAAEFGRRLANTNWSPGVRAGILATLAVQGSEGTRFLVDYLHDPAADLAYDALLALARNDPAVAAREARAFLDGPRAAALDPKQRANIEAFSRRAN